jgi:Ferritin-like domain
MSAVNPSTRRQLLQGALATGAIGATLLSASADAALAQTDADLVSTLLGTEMLAVFVYGHIVHSSILASDRQHLARHLLGHERAHARALSSALERLGGAPPPPLTSVSDADKLLAASTITGSLSQLRSDDDAVRLLIRLEVALQRGYYVAMSGLQDTELQHTAAQILAVEAQHSSTLVEALFPGDPVKAVPESFVEGNPGDGRV